ASTALTVFSTHGWNGTEIKMNDLIAIRWESLLVVAGALGLAVWALRDPETSPQREDASGPRVVRLRYRGANGTSVKEVESGAILGRSPDCALVIDAPTVSRHHARITFDAEARIEDLDSTNGTSVNGRRIEGSAVLRRGDRIALGAAKLSFLGIMPRELRGSKG
ncbi:MAG TPA: FHA domain-containing protein, partial [Candidatus Eremiobacteraceae bacterium]|nr:FHA domain-containing protein [Candidatus Eremiobacteraceae bacterium]